MYQSPAVLQGRAFFLNTQTKTLSDMAPKKQNTDEETPVNTDAEDMELEGMSAADTPPATVAQPAAGPTDEELTAARHQSNREAAEAKAQAASDKIADALDARLKKAKKAQTDVVKQAKADKKAALKLRDHRAHISAIHNIKARETRILKLARKNRDIAFLVAELTRLQKRVVELETAASTEE